MKILVINSGSSSIKYRLFDMARRQEIAGGVVERIGEPKGSLRHRSRREDGGDDELARSEPVPDHERGFALIGEVFQSTGTLRDPGIS